MLDFNIKKGINDKEVDELVKNLLTQMSLEEKVAQMSGKGFYDYFTNNLKNSGFGFAKPFPAGGLERLGIPPYKFTDGPRGCIQPGSTCFPVSMARGATWDIELEKKVGKVIGRECRAHEANLFGGVCINLVRHPAWGRAQESYGEDPFHLGEFGVALIQGVQSQNVMATAKHFAANSIENARFKINVKMDERTLREVYLPHFKKCVESGCATIMSAYNKLLGEYCGQNEFLLRKILKEEWGFKGFVHSDWVKGLHNTRLGILAGLDSEMPDGKFYGKRLIKRVQDGRIKEDLVDEAAGRILRTIIRFITKLDPEKYNKNVIACEEHVNLAREVAEKSMVLLKNQNNILPLSLDSIKNLAIIGSIANKKNTGDRGSSDVYQKKIVTPLQGIQKYCGEKVNILYDNASNLDRVKAIAQKADAVIIVVGYTYKDEGEWIPMQNNIGGDRTNLGLKIEEVELINFVSRINSKSIVVMIGGSAIIVNEWKENVPAIVMAWYSGMEGGNALANILFGEVNPSGKLPLTIPKTMNDLPFFDKNADEIEYGYYHGYTLMDKVNIEPDFPFGFGLSYTEYRYENITVNTSKDKIIASIDVTNIGSYEGQEIVQLYVGFQHSQIDRPKKLLRGFTRIHLKPKEKKTVNIKVNKKNLEWYNPLSKSWEFEDIPYIIMMGSSSKEEDLLNTTIKFP